MLAEGEPMATTKADRVEFGERVRYYRELRDLTPEDLAANIGKSVSTISRIETGSQNVAVGDIKALAAALQVPPSALIDAEGTLTPTAMESLTQSIVNRCTRKLEIVMRDLGKISV